MTSLAERLFVAQQKYVHLHHKLDNVVLRIFGVPVDDNGLLPEGADIVAEFEKCRAENWSVENDSAYDNSIEISMKAGYKITDVDIAALKALGFSNVWSDGHSPVVMASLPAQSLYMRIAALEKQCQKLVKDGPQKSE